MNLSSQWQAFRISFDVRDARLKQGSVTFFLAGTLGPLWFKNVALLPDDARQITESQQTVVPAQVVVSVERPNAAGALTLAAEDAATHGFMHYEPSAELDDLGWWGNPDDWAEWAVQVAKPGKFHVTALVAAQATGGAFTVAARSGAVTSDSVQGSVPNTGSYFNYKTIDLGTLTLTQAGKTMISVHPVAAGWPGMNLKSLTLTPLP